MDQTRLKAVMPVRRTQPSRFEFIDENEILEGKKNTTSNQRLVRAHVMREVRKKQKSKKQISTPVPNAARPLRRSPECQHPSTTNFVVNSSSDSSSSRSDTPPDDIPDTDLSSQGALGSSSWHNSPHPKSQVVFNVCSHCWKPLQTFESIPPKSSDSDVCFVDHEHWSGLILAKRRPEPITKAWITLADSFNAAGVGSTLGPDLQDSFPHFFHQFTVFNSSLYPLEPIEIQAMCATSAITEGESALLHIICFTGAMHLVASRLGGADLGLLGPENPDRRIAQAAIMHKSKALSLMNQVLADPDRAVTQSSIITVSLLAALEGVGGDMRTAEIHSRGLARMVEIRGGLSMLDNNVVGDIYTSDAKTAAIGLSKPAFPLTEYWIERVKQLSSNDFTVGSVLSSLGTRFFDPDLAQIFHPEMLRNFRFMRHLIKYTEYSKILRASQPLEGYTTGEFAVTEHLLLLFPYEGHPITSTNDHVQECARIAALLYCNLALWTCPPYFALVKAVVMKLRQAILRLDFSLCGRIYPDLMLWILFMGCLGAEGKTERSWFILNLADVAKSLGLRQWMEVKRLLVKFFYVGRILEAPFMKIWDEMFLIVDDS